MIRKDQIKHLIRSLDALPTLPSTAMTLITTVLGHDRSADSLVKCIEVDQAVTTRILKTANTPPYGKPGSVAHVRDAVRSIGLRTLRSMLLSNSVMDVFTDRRASYGIDPLNLWLHSIGAAAYARELSTHFPSLDPEEAFVAGLIHDMGKIFLCISFDDEYPKVVSLASAEKIPLHKAETAHLGFNHAEVGAWLIEQWNLPATYAEAVLHHHHPTEHLSSSARNFLLSCVVAVANTLSYRHAVGHGGDPDKAFAPPAMLKKANITDEIIEQAAHEAPLRIKKMTDSVELNAVPLSAFHSLLKKANRTLGEMTQDQESARCAFLQKEKELKGINTIGLSLLGCTATESAVKMIAENLVTSFRFSRALCTVYHHDHWEYHADAVNEGDEWICNAHLKKRSRKDDSFPELSSTSPWLHVDLLGKDGTLGYLRVQPGAHSDVPFEKLGLLLASYAKLVSEALERIQAYQHIKGLSEELARTIAMLDEEKGKVESERHQKETILTSLPIGVLLLDGEGTILFHNPEAQRCVLSSESLVGKRVSEFIRDTELVKGISAAGQGTRGSPREFSLPGSDPVSMSTIRWMLVPIGEIDVPSKRSLLVVEDLTEEKELQRHVMQSARMASIGELAAGTAHNLRSPLGAVKGILELLLEEIHTGRMTVVSSQDPEKSMTEAVVDQLKIVVRSLDKCFAVIDDLLSHSRIKDHGPEMLRLQELLDGTETLIGELLRERNILIEKDIQSDTLFGRKADLMQVFLNLYSNAYKAMPEGGLLKIKSRPYLVPPRSVPFCEILVIDTGRGIAPEYLPRIFDPFFTTSEFVEGTGLGLSLTYKIIRDHGGSVDVESRVGEGTTFIVRLPTAPEDSVAPPR